MKQKTSFTRLIRLWGVFSLIGIGISVAAIDIVSSYRDFDSRAAQMRAAYIAGQEQTIQQEVKRVVDLIHHEMAQSRALTKTKIKTRVYEAYAIAGNIYQQNKSAKSKDEIEQLIKDALRPIRFEQGLGYYFATRRNGVEFLFADKPEMEGVDLLEMQDTRGKFVIKDMIEIARKSGEGFYEYQWTKPDATGRDFQKISFIKRFEPFDWFIGTGLYVDDVEDQIKANLLSTISRIRFGKEGYIFINRLNGDALVSNGKLFSGTKKLWEIFDKNREQMKDIFEKEYRAALKPQGDYIYYSHVKLSNPDKESPKASFIYGIPEWQWLVGAGVYLDDVEADIDLMKTGLNHQIKAKMFFFPLTTMSIVTFFLFLFRWLNRRLENDVTLLISFFNRAALSDDPIDRDRVHFAEFDGMAENANRMLQDKIDARQSLLDERERLFVTIRSIGDGVITTDMAGRVELMNMVAEQLTGWKSDEVRGKPLNDIFTIENARTREKVQNPVEDVLENGQIVDLANHTLLISKDGAKHQIADSAAPIKDAGGRTTGVVLVFRDVTEEYRMREDLWQSEANLRTVFEAAKNIAFIKTDGNGENPKIIEFSPGAEQIFGYGPEEIIGRPVAILHLQEDVEKYPDAFENMRENKQGFYGESTLVRKSGETFPALFTTHPVFDNDGKMTAVIGVATDITERKRVEEELQKMEKLKSVGTLAGGIAHDFNNIMMGLYGNISLVKETLSKAHHGFRFLEEAEKSMNRAIRLTKQLLTFAKGGAPVMETISLEGLAEEIVRFDLSGSNVKPVFRRSENLWPAKADKGQLQQVFSNLIINAKQAMPDGGHLYIALENADIVKNAVPGLDPGRYIRITMADEGTGIDQKFLDRIFDPYFSTKQTGNGLGLATVYSIINKHGGRISVDSHPGKGTTFTLYLPASESRQLPPKQPEAGPLTLGQGARILVMDDEDMICLLVKEMLERFGFSVEIASDGRQAIAMYKQAQDAADPFDVVIMDLTIPGGVGGKEAIQEILKIDPQARAIVSSGYADDPVMANFAEYGFKGIAAKPYANSMLLDVLRRVLEKQPQEPPHPEGA